MSGGKGAAHHAGGEEAEVDRLHREGRGEKCGVGTRESRDHRAEVTEDPLAGRSGLRVPVGLDELSVLPLAHRDGAYERHTGTIVSDLFSA